MCIYIYIYIYYCDTVTTRHIKMGSEESHFNVSLIVRDKVSLIVRDKVTRQCPQITTFEEKGELKEYQTNRGPSTYQPITTRPNGSPCYFFLILFL